MQLLAYNKKVGEADPNLRELANLPYCTISIDSAWGVTCDAVDEILHMARLRRICDIEKNSAMSLSQACLKNLKLK